MTAFLTPAVAVEHLYPADVVYMARTDLEQTKFLGYTPLLLDMVTSLLAGLLNGKTAIRHEGGAQKEIFDLYSYGGFDVDEETLVYRSGEEAESLADHVISQGKRIISPYLLPADRFPDDGQLVPPDLYRKLNAKSNLESFVSPVFLPKRQLLSYESFMEYVPSGPVFFKSASDAPTGWGFAVQPCRNAGDLAKARRWFSTYRDSVSKILVEEWVDVLTCWCAGIVVNDHGVTCFGGAEQTFSSPAHQTGSVIAPDNAFPEEGQMLAVSIGEAARRLSFRGIAGLDIGLKADGGLVVFDPNFRINSSTTQLLFHEAACRRFDCSVSCSFQCHTKKTFGSVADIVKKNIDQGVFIPTRIFDGNKHPLANGRHTVTGFVLGHDRRSAEETVKLLEDEFKG